MNMFCAFSFGSVDKQIREKGCCFLIDKIESVRFFYTCICDSDFQAYFASENGGHMTTRNGGKVMLYKCSKVANYLLLFFCPNIQTNLLLSRRVPTSRRTRTDAHSASALSKEQMQAFSLLSLVEIWFFSRLALSLFSKRWPYSHHYPKTSNNHEVFNLKQSH